MDVTPITDAAGRADSLPDSEYRAIYDELREGRSLRQFIALLQSDASPSWWSQYEAGTKRLDWQRKNELRRAVGLAELAPSLASVLDSVSATASVWRIGAGLADRLLLLTPEAPDGLTLRVNGGVYIVDPGLTQNAEKATVTPITKAARATPAIQPTKPIRRTPYGALSLRRTTLDRLAQHRTGRTADALINALLDKWEQEPQP